MNVAEFISIDYLKETTGVNEAINTQKLRATIVDVQRRYIEPILGTDLYDKISSDIVAKSLTGNYETLVEKWIAPCIAFYAYMEVIPEIAIRVNNGGVFINQADNSTSANRNELDYLAQKQREKGEYYAQRLTDYLCNNSSLFPEYSTNSDEDLRPIDDDSPFNGIGLEYNYPRSSYERRTGQRP